jgi:hypothetical protein
MLCDDCSRTENCPPCPYEECKCGHERRFHQAAGCLACADLPLSILSRHSFIPKSQGSEPSSTDGDLPPKNHFFLCTCGHVKLLHKDQRDACKGVQCGCQGFICDHSRCGWKPREEEVPEPRCEGCGHTEGEGCGCPPQCVCGHSRGQHSPALFGTCEKSGCKCLRWRLTAPEEPPLTPEEEEEAPPDEDACDHLCECEHEQGDHSSSGHCKQCDCEMSTGHYVTECPEAPEDDTVHTCPGRWGGPQCACFELPPPEGPEYTPCVCGHIVPEHEPHGGLCFMDECDCVAYRTEPDFELPPQPERRAPYVATYSVGGHLYEVAVPGDACLQAVDGALVIRHGLGPVAGLVAFQPMTVEER